MQRSLLRRGMAQSSFMSVVNCNVWQSSQLQAVYISVLWQVQWSTTAGDISSVLGPDSGQLQQSGFDTGVYVDLSEHAIAAGKHSAVVWCVLCPC